MPDAIKTRRADRPTEGFTTAFLPAHPDRPVRLFLPSDYQQKYAYPLVVLFHPDGGDEDAAVRFAPLLSRRNYITACPRGKVALGAGPTGRPGFAWGHADARLDKYLISIVAHARRTYHVHSERIYLVGFGEGATVAYRLGLAMADRVAGVVALNGRMPHPSSRPLGRLKAVRALRVFVGHGTNNPVVPVSAARKAARLLDTAGADVRFQSYPATSRIDDDMLRDVNRWIMERVNIDDESLAMPND
jgi:phospholipase/carboxylesterase